MVGLVLYLPLRYSAFAKAGVIDSSLYQYQSPPNNSAGR